jgi:Ca2+-binding EF-hand superfamily protein
MKRNIIHRHELEEYLSLVLYKVYSDGCITYEVVEEFDDDTNETMTFNIYQKALNYFNKYIDMVG